MALSELAICNRALIALGEDVITSLDDNRSKAARLCKAAFPLVRDEVTRRVPWNCARARASLAADAVPPGFEWEFAYTLPADNLRVYQVAEDPDTPWEEEGGKLLTDHEAPLNIRYIRRLDDVTLIDAQLAGAISYALAADIAVALAQSEGAAARCVKLYEERVRLAAHTSASEHSVEELDIDIWLRSRF